MKLAGVRVLLAEDNPTNQLVATQMLESLGATVLLAEDGAEALELVAREPVDVMLVDIEMPRVNGIQVIRRLRASAGPLAQLPMIALTAYVMREHRAAIDAAGADGVIAKPILSIEQFGDDICRFMRKRSPVSSARPSGTNGNCVASTISDERSIIDRDIYDSLAETIGSVAMSEVLEKVESDIRSARARLVQALDPFDPSEVRAVTHILISVAGAVGAMPLQREARRLNEAAHRGDAGVVKDELPAVIGMIDGVLSFVCARAGG